MKRKHNSVWKHFEYPTFIVVCVLVLIGIATIMHAIAPVSNGASRGVRDIISGVDFSRVRMQIAWFAIGLVAMFGVHLFHYKKFERFFWPLFIASVALLVAVLVMGLTHYGTTGWLPLGPFAFQPSELCKVALIITLSTMLARFERVETLREALPALGVFAVYFVLVSLQNDFGTSMVYLGILLGLLFVARLRLRYFAIMFGSIAVAAVPIWFFVFNKIQRNRILDFIHPDTNIAGSGMHVYNSKMILGSGRWFGKGLFADNALGRQAEYLPVRTSDFIFTVLGEAFGFLGCLIVIGLFAFLIVRLWRIAVNCKDRFGSYVVYGVIFMLFFHIFENIGMTMGIMPVTGIPLPFISYGGSSFLSNMIAVGLAMNISMRRETGALFV